MDGAGPDHDHQTTILIVEDEESVKETVKRLLTEFDYTVYEATNVKDAMELFIKKKDEIERVAKGNR